MLEVAKIDTFLGKKKCTITQDDHNSFLSYEHFVCSYSGAQEII